MPKKPTYIYAVRSRKWVKIGLTNDVQDRLKTIQTCNPTKVNLVGYVEGNRAHESYIHLALTRWRTRGEWFEYVSLAADVTKKIGEMNTAEEVIEWIKQDIDRLLKEAEGND